MRRSAMNLKFLFPILIEMVWWEHRFVHFSMRNRNRVAHKPTHTIAIKRRCSNVNKSDTMNSVTQNSKLMQRWKKNYSFLWNSDALIYSFLSRLYSSRSSFIHGKISIIHFAFDGKESKSVLITCRTDGTNGTRRNAILFLPLISLSVSRKQTAAIRWNEISRSEYFFSSFLLLLKAFFPFTICLLSWTAKENQMDFFFFDLSTGKKWLHACNGFSLLLRVLFRPTERSSRITFVCFSFRLLLETNGRNCSHCQLWLELLSHCESKYCFPHFRSLSVISNLIARNVWSWWKMCRRTQNIYDFGNVFFFFFWWFSIKISTWHCAQ